MGRALDRAAEIGVRVHAPFGQKWDRSPARALLDKLQAAINVAQEPDIVPTLSEMDPVTTFAMPIAAAEPCLPECNHSRYQRSPKQQRYSNAQDQRRSRRPTSAASRTCAYIDRVMGHGESMHLPSDSER
jgi:hypothetical protein